MSDVADSELQTTTSLLKTSLLALWRKFRFDRGPLRWWIMMTGLITTRYDSTRFACGLAFVCAGAVLHFVSKAYLRQQAELTVAGPYRFCRNPFYLANLLVDCGYLLVIGQWWVAVPFLLSWAWIYHFRIAFEEATLTGLFGERHLAYCRQVPRFLPNPWKYLPAAQVTGPRFSLRNPNIYGGHTIQRVFRIVALAPLFVFAAGVREAVATSGRLATTPLVCGIAAVLLVVTGDRITAYFRRLSRRAAEQSPPAGAGPELSQQVRSGRAA